MSARETGAVELKPLERSWDWEVCPCLNHLDQIASWDLCVRAEPGARGAPVIASVYSGEAVARAILAACQATTEHPLAKMVREDEEMGLYDDEALSRPQPTPAGEIVERLSRMKHKTMPKGDWDTLSSAQDLIEQQAATIAERDARIEALEKALGAIIRKQDNGTGNAPGHGHSRIGIWDDDPGNAAVGRANLPCEWCETWNDARATLERTRGQ